MAQSHAYEPVFVLMWIFGDSQEVAVMKTLFQKRESEITPLPEVRKFGRATMRTSASKFGFDIGNRKRNRSISVGAKVWSRNNANRCFFGALHTFRDPP
jgi:hypothetical protein